ncbi:MAG: hypothetical protein OYK82_05265 [Gammaproteobacteria bacterium]|nr:hypothetical protein [Gammaproteobacteria bacterium]
MRAAILAVLLGLPLPAAAQGLGVSAQEIRGLVSRLDISLAYESGQLLSGESRTMGTSEDPFLMLELIGPASDLREIAFTTAPSANAAENVEALGITLILLTTVMSDWYTETLGSGIEERAIRVDGVEVTIRNYADVLGVVSLSLEAL